MKEDYWGKEEVEEGGWGRKNFERQRKNPE